MCDNNIGCKARTSICMTSKILGYILRTPPSFRATRQLRPVGMSVYRTDAGVIHKEALFRADVLVPGLA